MVEYESFDQLEAQILKEPDATYSYADYLNCSFEERVELIKGKFIKMYLAPRRTHQEVHANLLLCIPLWVFSPQN